METELEVAESTAELQALDLDLDVSEADASEADASEADEVLDDTAQGHGLTSDEVAVGTGEVDAIGRAAGLIVPDGQPFRGISEVERRDRHRWELDPLSVPEPTD